jgi:hypothetical protein
MIWCFFASLQQRRCLLCVGYKRYLCSTRSGRYARCTRRLLYNGTSLEDLRYYNVQLQCPSSISCIHIFTEISMYPRSRDNQPPALLSKAIYSSSNLQCTFSLPSDAIFSSCLSLLSTSPSLSTPKPITQHPNSTFPLSLPLSNVNSQNTASHKQPKSHTDGAMSHSCLPLLVLSLIFHDWIKV